MKFFYLFLLMLSLFFPVIASTSSNPGNEYENILTKLPDKVDLSRQYIIYLHGAIIERGESKPIHPRFGVYDYPAIKKALATNNVVLIAEQRKLNTNPAEYAGKVVRQINTLLSLGVNIKNITVVGFSKGAQIAILTSDALNRPHANFVIMANCGPWYDSKDFLKKLHLTGNVLSIYEKSDGPGSCKNIASRSPELLSFKEVEINTGKRHGAFFKPGKEWLAPLQKWINRAR